MSQPESYRPPTASEVFLEGLDTVLNGELDYGVLERQHEALGLMAIHLIYDSSLYGEPLTGGVNELIEPLRDAINRDDIQGVTKARLHGLFDVLWQASVTACPRIEQDEFKLLSHINEAGHVLLDEVRKFVFPPPPRPRTTEQGIAAITMPGVNELVLTVRVGKYTYVELSPKGREAIAAFQRRVAKEQS